LFYFYPTINATEREKEREREREREREKERERERERKRKKERKRERIISMQLSDRIYSTSSNTNIDRIIKTFYDQKVKNIIIKYLVKKDVVVCVCLCCIYLYIYMYIYF